MPLEALALQRLIARELMDDDQATGSFAEWRESLYDLAQVNRYLGGWSALKNAVDHLPQVPRTIVDVGTGDAYLAVRLVEYLAKRGVTASCVGLDKSEQILDIARERTGSRSDIKLLPGDARALPFPDRSFDLAMLNLSLHHFEPSDAVTVLREMARVAKSAVVNDLRRSRIAWAYARYVFPFFTRNRLTLNDGPMSVLRSYTPYEATELARHAGWQRINVRKSFGYRLVVVGGLG